jgi:hypothetical protein
MFRLVRFKHFKALNDYSVSLKDVNVLVGPNNAGKSTVLEAFRALEGALRFARRSLPEPVRGPGGRVVQGYQVPASSLAISLKNIHSDYRELETTVSFTVCKHSG